MSGHKPSWSQQRKQVCKLLHVLCNAEKCCCLHSSMWTVCPAEWVSVNSCSPCVPATCNLNKSWIFIYRVENYQDFLLFNPQSLLMSPITMLFPSQKGKTGSLIKYTIFFHKRRHHKLRKMTYVNEWRISKIFILPFDKQIVSALRIKSLNKTTWKPTMSKLLLSWPQY